MKNNSEIYKPEFVESLFDTMSHSYKRMNYITSFGFSERWRKQHIASLDIKEGDTVVDLLTGMGECWEHILKKSGKDSTLIALDFSKEMIKHARRKKSVLKDYNIEILEESVFDHSIKNDSADFVVSGFGLKTFSAEQLDLLAKETYKILKSGGQFSFIDVSVPSNKFLRLFYMFYLKWVIPILGWIMMGNGNSYKMLGVYTEQYGDSKEVEMIFKNHDFEVEYLDYFFGCASGIRGRKL